MATWEDGPEYAPVRRPDAYDLPDTPALSEAPPYRQPAALAPQERPHFAEPAAPATPLAALVPAPEQPRDPTVAYEVVTSSATATTSAWAAAHWSGPSPTSAPSPSAPPGGWAPPTGALWAPPVSHPFPPPGGPPVSPTGLPAPGTQQWFAPGDYPPPAPARPVTARAVVEALTPGLLITLIIGGLIAVIAPVALLIAWGLASRVTVAQDRVRRALGVALAVLAAIALYQILITGLVFDLWWDAVAWTGLIASWVVLVAVVVITVRVLRAAQPGQRRR